MVNIEDIKQNLQNYIDAKQYITSRIAENEKLYNAHKWSKTNTPYLMNSIMNKHADIMDSFPEVQILPQAEDDVYQANMLSDLIPIILRKNDYEGLYSDCTWEKLKHGTSIQGVFWDNMANNMQGDIVIKNIDISRMFWEPNVSDIQDSKYVYYISLISKDNFIKAYPNIKPESSNYLATNSDDIEIVDCYFKANNRLELVKFAGDNVLYESLSQPLPIYAHGKYPFVFDRLYSMKDSPTGFGIVDIVKNSQRYIDELYSYMLDNAKMSAKKRFFIRLDGGVNEQEFANWDRDFIHVAGSINDESIRELSINPLDSSCYALLQAKIEELKECSGNRDFNQGSVSAGVTAASAISALQEAGNKISRDIIRSSYRAFTELCSLIIELVREFYTSPRTMRIMGDTMEFRLFTNEKMQAKDGMLPHYDIVLKAQKASPFSTLAQNEMAKEFYAMGLFKPENKKEALACISMMNFEGKEAVISSIQDIM